MVNHSEYSNTWSDVLLLNCERDLNILHHVIVCKILKYSSILQVLVKKKNQKRNLKARLFNQTKNSHIKKQFV